MSASSASSRWTDQEMTKRVRRRYRSERIFRGIGFAAISLSVLFLAFLLWNMASKGIGGFSQYEAALPIDFSKSDLFLDPATIKGPDARTTVAGADLSTAISKAAEAAYGPDADRMFSDAAVDRLTDAIVANPDILTGTSTLWLPVSSKVDIAAKGDGEPAAEKVVSALQQ